MYTTDAPPPSISIKEPFYYSDDNRQLFVGTLEECARAILEGKISRINQGEWYRIVGGRKTILKDEPLAIKTARKYVDRNGIITKRFVLAVEWKPSGGFDITIRLY